MRELPEDASYRSYQGIRCCMSGSITTIVPKPKTFHQSPPPPNLPARYLIRFLPDFSSDFFPIIPSDFFAISHQMSSRLLIQVSLLSLSRISEKTTDVGFRDVQLRPNQVPLSQRPLTVFIRRALFSSKFRCLRSDFICCCNRGCLPTARRGKSLSIRRTKFSSRRSGSWREQQLQLNRRKM